jgi:uncharacterized protein (DUF2147 family)
MKALAPLLIAATALMLATHTAHASGIILGQWITDSKDLIVEVYRVDDAYKARIVWVSDKEPNKRVDDKNPDPSLRSRKVVGMDVLEGLTYNKQEDCWENGEIYDATSGKTWSASVKLQDDETLIVRGYWGFKIFGKTLRFKKYRQLSTSR